MVVAQTFYFQLMIFAQRLSESMLRFFIQLSLLVLVGFIILRFFPILFRVVQLAGLGLAQFWWAILLVGLLLGLILFLTKKS